MDEKKNEASIHGNERENEIRKQMIMMVIRQTEYDYDAAEKKLIDCGYNYDMVIKEYMGIKPKEEQALNTKNQEVYRQIRNMMDEGDKQYSYNKEMQEKHDKIIAYNKHMYERNMKKK